MANYISNFTGEEVDELLKPATINKRGTVKGSNSVTIASDGTASVKKYYYHNVTINVTNNTNIKQFWTSFITSNQNPITIINATNFPYRPFVRVGIIYEGASGYAYKPITLFSDTTGSRFTIFAPSGILQIPYADCSIASDAVVEV